MVRQHSLLTMVTCAAVTLSACGSGDVHRRSGQRDAGIDAADSGVLGEPGEPADAFLPPPQQREDGRAATEDASDGAVTADAAADARESGLSDAEPGLLALAVASRGGGSGSVISDPVGIDCAAPCEASFPPGSAVTLTAVPEEHSRFIGWTGGCTTTASTCTVTMDEARRVEAVFSPEQFPVVVRKAGTGTGTVSADSGKLACGATCAGSYDYGARVTLIAAPDATSTFGGWVSCPAPEGAACVVDVSAALEVTATFLPAPRTLQIVRNGTGIGTVVSTPAGINCGPDCSEVYAHGTNVVLTAAPNVASYFTGFTGCPSPSGNTCGLSMTQARDVTASFAANQSPSVVISSPADGTTTADIDFESPTGRWFTLVTLTGSGTDPEDGALSGGSLVWTTDETSVQPALLGTGASLTVALYKPRECVELLHHITLTATDSKGRSTTRTITFDHRYSCS